MAALATITVEGLQPLLFKLRLLDRKVQRKLKKDAVNAAAKVVLKEARRLVPRGETGLLKQSLGVKAAAKGLAAVALVGPKTGGRWVGPRKGVQYKKFSKLGEKYTAAGVYPPYYAHMVEKGHGPPRGPAAPHPFLGPALESEKAAAIMAMRDVLTAGIEAAT